MSILNFYNTRSCNDDYVPVPHMSRSAYIDYTNENDSYINNYPGANIQFRETVGEFKLIADSCFEPDAHLEEVDASLSEPSCYVSPDYEEDYDDDYDEYCIECHEKKQIGFDMCNDCLYLFSSPVSVDETYVNGEDLELNREMFPWELDSRDSALARNSDGEPAPYLNKTNDDLPDINVFLKTASLKTLNEKFHSNQALSMEDYEELEKYSHKTQLSLLDSVSYSRHCHRCGDDMAEKRFKQIYCCENCEIAVEVYENDCIHTKLSNGSCKICSNKSNLAFNMRYDVLITNERIKFVREFAKENRLTMTIAIPVYAELNDCGEDCKLCYRS